MIWPGLVAGPSENSREGDKQTDSQTDRQPGKQILKQYIFHQLGPLGQVGLVVTKSVCLSVCLLSPSHAIFLRGRTGAERALSVDWCNLDLDLDLK